MNSLSPNLQTLLDAPIIELDTVDSTNNYAMQLIDADTAQPGLTITTREQTQGKGQRGRQWHDIPGQSLLVSIIVRPDCPLDQQFIFNAAVAVAIAEVLTDLFEGWDVRIKWPNDIIINDKKAVGILIENVLRGSNWNYAIIGFGLNVAQASFPPELPVATSLKIASGRDYEISMLLQKIRENIFRKSCTQLSAGHIMAEYNDYLYRRGREQSFANDTDEWKATIVNTEPNGKLSVQLPDGSLVYYTHGSVQWKWQ